MVPAMMVNLPFGLSTLPILSDYTSSIAKKLKDELLNGGWLGSPKSDSTSASVASLDDTTVSSSGSISAGSSISELVLSSIRELSPSPKAKSWVQRLSCGIQLCGCKDSEDDKTLLHSAVDENAFPLDTYSL